MSRNTRSSRLLIAGLGIGLALPAMAWIPCGPWGRYSGPPPGMGAYGPGLPPPVYPLPYGNASPDAPTRAAGETPGLQPDGDVPSGALPPSPGYGPPGHSPNPWGNPQPPFGTGAYGPGLPPPAYPLPYGNASPDAPTQAAGETPGLQPDGNAPSGALSPSPGYGPHPSTSRAYPGPGRQGFGRPAGLRVSRATSDDAYTLTIPLDGMDPETIQVHTQDHWLLLRRTHSAQQTRNDDLGDGRGFTRSFSYSSGATSRRLSVPGDGILSAMSREDGEDNIRIRIPRRGRHGAGQE